MDTTSKAYIRCYSFGKVGQIILIFLCLATSSYTQTSDTALEHSSLLAVTSPHIIKSKIRLAVQEDFKHKGCFVHKMYYNGKVLEDPINGDNSKYKYEFDIPDHEEWWAGEDYRYLSYPVPIFVSDNATTLFTMQQHTIRNGTFDATWDFAARNQDLVESILSSYSKEERMKKPYLCKRTSQKIGHAAKLDDSRSETLTPYHFTVLGDSHTGIFDAAALRIQNMNVSTVKAATMYGLKNLNSISGASRRFRGVINERRNLKGSCSTNDTTTTCRDSGMAKEEEGNNILVFNLGDCDVHGLGWEKYLLNESEGIERSLRVFGDFLKEHVEVPGGYDKVIVVLPPPPLHKLRHFVFDTSGDDPERRYLLPSLLYEDRMKSVAKFNEAIKTFCMETRSSYCSVLDIYQKVLGPNGVFRPYVSWVHNDNHLVPHRTFGVILEQLRSLLDAEWCMDDVDDSDNDDDSNIQPEISPELLQVAVAQNDKHIGFEPVLFELSVRVDGKNCIFYINVVHYLTPKQLVHEMSHGRFIEWSVGNDLYLERFVTLLRQQPETAALIEKTLADFVGDGWGEQEHTLLTVDDELNYVFVPKS